VLVSIGIDCREVGCQHVLATQSTGRPRHESGHRTKDKRATWKFGAPIVREKERKSKMVEFIRIEAALDEPARLLL
jgi:hypothetical protein